MKLLFSFILLLNLCFAQDTLTVVAVGEAEVEKDSVYFSNLESEQVKKDEINKIIEIIQSDFKFYIDLFDVDMNIRNTKIKTKSGLSVEFKTSSEKLSVILKNLKAGTVLLEQEKEFTLKSKRVYAHEISHDLYRAITGKNSIFKSKIVFISDRVGSANKVIKELYEMDFDGFNKRRLTYLNSMMISPAISYDNKKILYSVIEHRMKKSSSGVGLQKVKNINLYLLDLETKKSKLLSNIEGINSGAVFNKSGDSIYLTLSYLKNADIYKMNLKTGQKKRITSHFSDDVDPHINGDESLMTFLSGRPGRAMIYTLDPTGKEKSVKRIGRVGRFNASPRFNPSGSEIVFSSWVDDRFDIYRINSDGRNLVRLTKNFGSNEEPWFSPDGQFIVFTSQRVISQKKAVQDIYIMNRDGEVIRKVSENYGKIYTPRWSN